MSARLLLLATTHRVPPGLLSWPAWQALHEGEVLTGTPDHAQLPYLREAGVDVEVVEAGSDAERARLLLDRARPDHTVVWLAGPGGDAGLMRALGQAVAAAPESSPEVEVLHGSYDLPGGRLLDLVTTMDRLRSPGGCPWDREQTHASLAPYLLEEAYEVVETVETGDLQALCGELGDVLLQVAFHARVAEEREDDTGFTIDDVAGQIVDKLVRRHPHVFGDTRVSGADEVRANWDAIKAAERADGEEETSILDGVPLAQPALSLAAALQKRAARAGVPGDLLAAPHAEDTVATSAAASAAGSVPARDLGTELFALVARARAQDVDPEAALRQVAREFRERVLAVEESVREEWVDPSSLGAEEWRARWRDSGG